MKAKLTENPNKPSKLKEKGVLYRYNNNIVLCTQDQMPHRDVFVGVLLHSSNTQNLADTSISFAGSVYELFDGEITLSN